MDINITLDIKLPADLATALAKLVGETTKPAGQRTLGQALAAGSSAQAPAAEEKPSKAPKSAAKAPAPAKAESAAAATAAEGTAITIEALRKHLGDYSADKRFGSPGVVALLKKYGVAQVSKIPEDKYQEVYDDITAQLAEDPLA